MPNYSFLSQQTTKRDPQILSSNNSSLSLRLEIDKIEIDPTLTFSSAEAKGYQWVKDTIFSSQTPTIFQGIISLVAGGYRLGRPKMATESKVLVGLYKPKA